RQEADRECVDTGQLEGSARNRCARAAHLYIPEINVVRFETQPVERAYTGDDLEAVIVVVEAEVRSRLDEVVPGVDAGTGHATANVNAVIGRLRDTGKRHYDCTQT